MRGVAVQTSVFGLIGAGAFGLVIGWIAYRTLRRAADGSRIADLVTVVAALGGGAVINGRFPDPDLFAGYGIGLAVGFFGYFVTGALIDRAERRAPAAPAAAPVPAQIRTAPAAEPQPAEGAGPRTSTWMGD
ncbi:hypothetical protein [Kitasatospora sp. NPDC059571]|uniref:hypothetical protein n=1 Tax=Kitasatospora sp. NPDC059571 TaxID=3346871 RepID=UPI003677B5F4